MNKLDYKELSIEMDKMKNVNLIIEGLNKGAIQTNNEEAEYVHLNGSRYISHGVENHEGVEVFYGQREDINEVNPNELADIYDYNEVAAYRLNGHPIVWL